MTRYAVVIISPPGYVHSLAFQEVAETLYFGLSSLGHDTILSTDIAEAEGRRPIILGSNLLPHYWVALPPDAILYNLEQVDRRSDWITLGLWEIFYRHRVWDYSERNAAALRSMGIRVDAVVPIGYAPQLTRIQSAETQDIDVLFCGSLNPRRSRVLNEMRQAGLHVEAHFGLYGEERDRLIARSKVVLNVHFYAAKVMEMVRISYLLANRCVVLTEPSADEEADAQLGGAVAFAEYEDLARRACELVDRPEERRQLAQAGFECIIAQPIASYLQKALI